MATNTQRITTLETKVSSLESRVTKLEKPITPPPPPPTDTDADVNKDLKVVNLVQETNTKKVNYTVSGLDSDATAVVTFKDTASKTATANVLYNGTFLVDLTALANGTITATIKATDKIGNTATGASSTMILKGVIAIPPPPPPGGSTPVSDFVGPFKTAAEITALGGALKDWRDAFYTNQSADATEAAGWGTPYDEVNSSTMGAVYERPMILYSFAEGDPTNATTFRTTANNLCVGHQNYMSGGIPNEPNQQWLSLALHYLQTGNTTSKNEVGWAANRAAFYQANHWYDTYVSNPYMSLRILAHAMSAVLAAHRISAPTTAGPNGGFPNYGGTWTTLLRAILNDILSLQAADGGWRFESYSYSVSGFQTGMLCDVLRVYYRWFEQDSRIPTAIKKAMNFLWENMLTDDGECIIYAEALDEGSGPQAWWDLDSDDLNGWYLNTLGFLYYMTGDTTYRTRADILLTRATSGAFLTSYKQLSEFARSAMCYPWYRATTPLASTSVINSVAPAITGVGTGTLTCSTGTWSGSPTFTRQWKRYKVPTFTPLSNLGTGSTQTETGQSGYRVYCVVTPSGDGIPARSNVVTVA